MKKYLTILASALFILSSTLAHADPCDANTKSHAAISAAGKIVSGLASTNIFVCQYNFTGVAGTSATYTLQQGTGTNCGTGTTSLTGAFPGSAGAFFSVGDGGFNVLTATGGSDLCITFGGSGGSAQGSVTYVQLPY